MKSLVFEAYLELIRFDLFLSLGNFTALHSKVRHCPVSTSARQRRTVEEICSAVDLASIWYWKEALCLQRSAATASLLKKHGVPAQMVLGARALPFKAHAWVEVAGSVVNDKPYTPQIYAVLDRC